MKKNKGAIAIIISIIIVVLGGAGFLYYQNNQKNNKEISNSPTLENKIENNTEKSNGVFDFSNKSNSNLSAKETFLRRYQETYNAKSFDEILKIMQKYDTEEQIKEAKAEYQNASKEQKEALFNILKAFWKPLESLKNIQEVVNGEQVEITADTENGGVSATLIKENGNWKISDIGGF